MLIQMRLIIFLVSIQYGLACKYGIIFTNINKQLDKELHLLIPGIKIFNQARLKHKFI